jgi:hypothetical protein
MMADMDRPRVRVDFNEMVAENLVLLAKGDDVSDSAGGQVRLTEGMAVHIYEEDPDEDGNPGALIADGVVERNEAGGWTSAAKWNCRINSRGIRRWPED